MRIQAARTVRRVSFLVLGLNRLQGFAIGGLHAGDCIFMQGLHGGLHFETVGVYFAFMLEKQ